MKIPALPVKKHYYLDADLIDRVRRLAQYYRLSQSQVVYMAVDQFCKQKRQRAILLPFEEGDEP